MSITMSSDDRTELLEMLVNILGVMNASELVEKLRIDIDKAKKIEALCEQYMIADVIL